MLLHGVTSPVSGLVLPPLITSDNITIVGAMVGHWNMEYQVQSLSKVEECHCTFIFHVMSPRKAGWERACNSCRHLVPSITPVLLAKLPERLFHPEQGHPNAILHVLREYWQFQAEEETFLLPSHDIVAVINV